MWWYFWHLIKDPVFLGYCFLCEIKKRGQVYQKINYFESHDMSTPVRIPSCMLIWCGPFVLQTRPKVLIWKSYIISLFPNLILNLYETRPIKRRYYLIFSCAFSKASNLGSSHGCFCTFARLAVWIKQKLDDFLVKL